MAAATPPTRVGVRKGLLKLVQHDLSKIGWIGLLILLLLPCICGFLLGTVVFPNASETISSIQSSISRYLPQQTQITGNTCVFTGSTGSHGVYVQAGSVDVSAAWIILAEPGSNGLVIMTLAQESIVAKQGDTYWKLGPEGCDPQPIYGQMIVSK